jgi:hypothetical protein
MLIASPAALHQEPALSPPDAPDYTERADDEFDVILRAAPAGLRKSLEAQRDAFVETRAAELEADDRWAAAEAQIERAFYRGCFL